MQNPTEPTSNLYAERGLVDTLPSIFAADIATTVADDVARHATRCATCGDDGDCPDCEPIAIGQRFTHLGFGSGTVIAITDDERLNVQVKFDSPSRYGSKFWFDTSEVVRPLAVTLQSIAIESKINTCANCSGIHHIQSCPELLTPLLVESWTGINLGRGLCRMRRENYTNFVQLLSEATPARLVEYAVSYLEFIRNYNPASLLTVPHVLKAWGRTLSGDRGPAAPAMQVAA